MENTPVLVLNASYEPIRIASAKKAVKLLVKGRAVTEVAHDREVYRGMQLPSVVRLRHFARVPHIAVLPTSRNVLLRDGYRCQYCDKRLTKAQLTLDHVQPRAQGGQSSWENLVACCGPCNRKKADRTPEQAEMPLLSRPRQRTVHTSKFLIRIMGQDDPMWKQYLYY